MRFEELKARAARAGMTPQEYLDNQDADWFAAAVLVAVVVFSVLGSLVYLLG